MEGYYADPGNGGNRDGIAWQMIGFTGDGMTDPNASYDVIVVGAARGAAWRRVF